MSAVDMSEVHDLGDYVRELGLEPFRRRKVIEEEHEELTSAYFVIRLKHRLVCSDAVDGGDTVYEGKTYKAGWWVIERSDWWTHNEDAGENNLHTSWTYHGPFKTKREALEKWS